MNYLKTEPRDSPEPAPGLDEWDRMMATLIDVRFGHGQSDAAAFIAKMAREKSESACVAAHARGQREGLERAARECDERVVLNNNVEGQDSRNAGQRALEGLECAFAIRALMAEAKGESDGAASE